MLPADLPGFNAASSYNKGLTKANPFVPPTGCIGLRETMIHLFMPLGIGNGDFCKCPDFSQDSSGCI